MVLPVGSGSRKRTCHGDLSRIPGPHRGGAFHGPGTLATENLPAPCRVKNSRPLIDMLPSAGAPLVQDKTSGSSSAPSV